MTDQYQKQLGNTLWGIADQLRGAMNADDFRDYMLSFLFLRYLSDNYETAAQKELGPDYPKHGMGQVLTFAQGTGKDLTPKLVTPKLASLCMSPVVRPFPYFQIPAITRAFLSPEAMGLMPKICSMVLRRS